MGEKLQSISVNFQNVVKCYPLLPPINTLIKPGKKAKVSEPQMSRLLEEIYKVPVMTWGGMNGELFFMKKISNYSISPMLLLLSLFFIMPSLLN